ncbi:MAG: hypothetical protein ETSY1_03715, partial [Candidatus Entotheonella factor]
LPLIISLGLGAIGLLVLLQHIEHLFLDQQIKAQAHQATQVVRLLENQLAQGKTPSAVVQQLQEQLATMPVSDTDFLCLLDPHGAVISHPDVALIGQSMSLKRMTSLESQAPKALRRQLAKGAKTTGWLYAQPCGYNPQIVYQKPVNGAPWTLSVHRNIQQLNQYMSRLRQQLLRIVIPIGLCILLGGVFLVRWLNYTQEQKIKNELEVMKSQYGTLIEQATDSILV